MKCFSKIIAVILCLMASVGAQAAWAAPVEDVVWTYSGEITQKGSKSEGYIGRLFYSGKPLSPKLGQVVFALGNFTFQNPDGKAWSLVGWKMVSSLQQKPVVKIEDKPSPDGQIHWGASDIMNNARGSWVFLPLYNYWVDPEYLQVFVDEMLKTVPEPDKTLAETLAKDVGANPDQISATSAIYTYIESIANKGSRSAGWRGKLLYNGRAIRTYSEMRVPLGTFYEANTSQLWEPIGLFPGKDAPVKNTTLAITNEELEKGSYKGPRKVGTPSDWCYVPFMELWISPDKL